MKLEGADAQHRRRLASGVRLAGAGKIEDAQPFAFDRKAVKDRDVEMIELHRAVEAGRKRLNDASTKDRLRVASDPCKRGEGNEQEDEKSAARPDEPAAARSADRAGRGYFGLGEVRLLIADGSALEGWTLLQLRLQVWWAGWLSLPVTPLSESTKE